MASCPTTIVFYSEDKINFRIKYALVVVKQLFQYGVKEIQEREDRIFISLSYSSRDLNLKRKFGNHPVCYMWARIKRNEEFKILEKVVKRYKFNLLDEEGDPTTSRLKAGGGGGGTKRKLAIEEVCLSSREEDEAEQQQQKQEEPQQPEQQQ